jgi:hypothetical protein
MILTPQKRRTHRASIKAVEEASQDFAVDVAALRDDVENRAHRCPNLFARRPPRWEQCQQALLLGNALYLWFVTFRRRLGGGRGGRDQCATVPVKVAALRLGAALRRLFKIADRVQACGPCFEGCKVNAKPISNQGHGHSCHL